MSVEMLGKESSDYTLILAAERGGDPLNPKNSRVRTGAWSKAAFLIGPVDDNGASVAVGIWVSTRELPEYAPKKQMPYRLHLLNGGKQVGLMEGAVTDDDWTLFRPEVRQGHRGGPVKWKVLIGSPGADTLEYRAAGR